MSPQESIIFKESFYYFSTGIVAYFILLSIQMIQVEFKCNVCSVPKRGDYIQRLEMSLSTLI